MKKRVESKTLNDAVENNIDREIQERLNALKALGIDETLFTQFEERVKVILLQNPGYEKIALVEINKTTEAMTDIFQKTTLRKRGMLKRAADNDISTDILL